MADFLESVLSAEEPVIPEPEPIVEPQPEPVEQPAQPEPAEEPPAEPIGARPEPGFVPISALMDERDKRKAAEARAQQFQAIQPQPAIPDPLDDPNGYAAYQANYLDEALVGQKLQISGVMAKQAHGEDATNTAVEWASSRAAEDPQFRALWQVAIRQEAHPIDWIVRQHKRDAMLSAIGDTPLDDWFTQEAARRGYAPQSAPVAAAPVIPMSAAPPVPRPAAPPRSIAADTSVSAPIVTDAKAEFEAIFNGR